MREPTIDGRVLDVLLAFDASGVSRAASVTDNAPLRSPAAEGPGARLPLAHYVARLRELMRRHGNPALALQFGASVDIADLSLGAVIGAACPSMDEAWAMLNRYSALTIDVDTAHGGDRFVIERRAGETWIVDDRRDPNDSPEVTESTFARIACTARRLCDARVLRSVYVTHPRPAHYAAYHSLFGVPVIFASRVNALVFETRVMTFHPPAPSTVALGALREHGDRLLSHLVTPPSVTEQVKRSLRAGLSTDRAGIVAVSRALGVSRHTLFRQLRMEGVTFRAVLDDVRREVALACLLAERCAVKQAARRAGFSEPAAFSRAFKRWTGESPRAFVVRELSPVSLR